MLFIIISIVINGCSSPASDKILFDFETDEDLDRIHWKCHALMALSDEHATHGEKTLRLELYPSAYPGFNPVIGKMNWKGYQAICFDIYNPGDNKIPVSIRIDDNRDSPDYEDRFTKKIVLEKGLNRIQLNLKDLITNGSKRHLNLKRIFKCSIFMVNPKQRHVLYLDNIRLRTFSYILDNTANQS